MSMLIFYYNKPLNEHEPWAEKSNPAYFGAIVNTSCWRKTNEQNGFDIFSSPDTTFVQLKSFSMRPFWF